MSEADVYITDDYGTTDCYVGTNSVECHKARYSVYAKFEDNGQSHEVTDNHAFVCRTTKTGNQCDWYQGSICTTTKKKTHCFSFESNIPFFVLFTVDTHSRVGRFVLENSLRLTFLCVPVTPDLQKFMGQSTERELCYAISEQANTSRKLTPDPLWVHASKGSN